MLARIGRLYAIEKGLKETLAQQELTGLAADAVRLAVRQAKALQGVDGAAAVAGRFAVAAAAV